MKLDPVKLHKFAQFLEQIHRLNGDSFAEEIMYYLKHNLDIFPSEVFDDFLLRNDAYFYASYPVIQKIIADNTDTE